MKGNYKTIDDDLLKRFEAKYSFEATEDLIIVRSLDDQSFKRAIVHDLYKPVTLNISKERDKKKYLILTKEAQEIWVSNYKKEVSLIAIQKALSDYRNSCKTYERESFIVELEKFLKERGYK